MYGIKARLKDTSASWVAMFLVVMSLVRLAKEVPYFLHRSIFSFMAEIIRKIIVEMEISGHPTFITSKMSF
jgi:hypothetical protein